MLPLMSALMGVNTGDPRQSGDKIRREIQIPSQDEDSGMATEAWEYEGGSLVVLMEKPCYL